MALIGQWERVCVSEGKSQATQTQTDRHRQTQTRIQTQTHRIKYGVHTRLRTDSKHAFMHKTLMPKSVVAAG